MNPNDEEFTINWEELKFLIEYANSGIRFQAEGGPKSDYVFDLEAKIQGLEEKFDYKAKVQRDRQEEEQSRREEEVRKRQEEFKPIKTKVLELSTKFSRLFLKEIAEECKINNPGLIRRAIEDMIEKKEINAKYFSSSESVVFELK
jgi:hypothetical protein